MTCQRELIRLPPSLLYDIATDIQVTDKWKQFAFKIGFTNQSIILLEVSKNDRFPAENVMYHWFSKNPKVDDLADKLVELDLERPLRKLEQYLTRAKYNNCIEKIESKKSNYNNYTEHVDSNVSCQQETNYQNQNRPPTNTLIQTQVSNTSTVSDQTIPEAGPISVEGHSPNVPRGSLLKQSSDSPIIPNEIFECDVTLPKLKIFTTILNLKSYKFHHDEVSEQSFVERFMKDGQFQDKIRGFVFNVKSFSLKKISDSVKLQRQLYNIIWAATTLRFHRFPVLSGFYFTNDYLCLCYPDVEYQSLNSLLHLPHRTAFQTISAFDRLTILIAVGEALQFMHNGVPYAACHGRVTSSNVLVSSRSLQNIVLTGFEKFYCLQPEYLRGLETIESTTINIEDVYKLDIKMYLGLIGEVWWNIHSDLITDDFRNDSFLPKVQYSGWNIGLHSKIRDFIVRFSEENEKSSPKCEEIKDGLEEIQRSLETFFHNVNDPPPYDNEFQFTDKR